MEKRTIVKATSPYLEKKICVFEVVKNVVNIYVENGYGTITNAELKQRRSEPRTGTHLMVYKNEKDPEYKLKSLEMQYKMIIIEQKLLFDLTGGKMNLFKTGSVAKTSTQLWYDICKPPSPAKIQQFESEIIESTYLGALIWAIPYKGYGYKYDFCSEYPAIMRSDHSNWPIDEGKLTMFTNEECHIWKYFKYGIYHAVVHDADYRLFKTNKKNWYTHIDLNRCLELKYKIELIDDGEPNALMYSKFVNGCKLFKPFIDYLFPFKKVGHKCIKKYINALAGALCESDKITIHTTKSAIIYEDKEILTIKPMGRSLSSMHSNNVTMDIVKPSKMYMNDYARIKCFLVSKGRYNISKIIEKNLGNVVHVHTDGIILKQEIEPTQKLGKDIGDLAYECRGECIIKNCTNFKFITKDDI